MAEHPNQTVFKIHQLGGVLHAHPIQDDQSVREISICREVIQASVNRVVQAIGGTPRAQQSFRDLSVLIVNNAHRSAYGGGLNVERQIEGAVRYGYVASAYVLREPASLAGDLGGGGEVGPRTRVVLGQGG